MATAMAATAAERAVLEEEFRWLLHAEVHAVLRQLQDILKEASLRFTLPGSGTEGPAKQENFILGSSGTDQVKGVLTLQGDALSQADVNLKMPRNNQLLHLAFREDKQWKLQQIQDARNHVSQAIYLLAHRDESYQFKTGAEVLKLYDLQEGVEAGTLRSSPRLCCITQERGRPPDDFPAHCDWAYPLEPRFPQLQKLKTSTQPSHHLFQDALASWTQAIFRALHLSSSLLSTKPVLWHLPPTVLIAMGPAPGPPHRTS
ncbi:protein rogdi homolog isoform 2-T2 [Erethizon dorsatum]